MDNLNNIQETSNTENKISYHFDYTSFTELFDDIKKAALTIVDDKKEELKMKNPEITKAITNIIRLIAGQKPKK